MNNTQTLSPSTSEASKKIILNHLNSFQHNDLNAVMGDYTNDSVLITQDGTYKGLDAIKSFFIRLIIHFPKEKSSFDLDTLVIDDEFAYIVWHARTPSLTVPIGSDTFVIRNGKIYQQSFVGQLIFIH